MMNPDSGKPSTRRGSVWHRNMQISHWIAVPNKTRSPGIRWEDLRVIFPLLLLHYQVHGCSRKGHGEPALLLALVDGMNQDDWESYCSRSTLLGSATVKALCFPPFRSGPLAVLNCQQRCIRATCTRTRNAILIEGLKKMKDISTEWMQERLFAALELQNLTLEQTEEGIGPSISSTLTSSVLSNAGTRKTKARLM